ncbi:DedA family protein [Aureimonas phyllosphaerae]|uniref:Membrane protein DedA with SNARE-associated domain n=1 Tax=Aureimonas phyllosphaerae TaxID=1166078 RepID=A0A7W6FV87_9HYPH|nr:DedA family protein [Aureimonas phyllosphaerae]MBB3936570.1 membrane protein DedA with SNARE-associated domain [Aureimonas phyllosphaerae]MBB3960566.1 membrane protein DedA with SNARE-associated domain [Aureimonas phyllosphaerae]SFF24689.1 membrane protein DedA, SNARE-associated domain [Aureimonas phyllosphaerae]
MTIESLVAQYGLPAIFLGAGFEGETVAILAGVAAHAGTLGYWPTVLVAGLGSFTADQIFFVCGRFFRHAQFVRRISARPFFAKALNAFEKRPLLFTFGFRFVYGFRTVSPIAIGTTQLPTLRFVLINVAAATTWALVFVSAGFWFGHGIETIFGHLRSHHRLLVFIVGALLLVGTLALWARHRWTLVRS